MLTFLALSVHQPKARSSFCVSPRHLWSQITSYFICLHQKCTCFWGLICRCGWQRVTRWRKSPSYFARWERKRSPSSNWLPYRIKRLPPSQRPYLTNRFVDLVPRLTWLLIKELNYVLNFQTNYFNASAPQTLQPPATILSVTARLR
jgi:hypothetical protein